MRRGPLTATASSKHLSTTAYRVKHTFCFCPSSGLPGMPQDTDCVQSVGCCTHEEAIHGPPLVQWIRFTRNPQHAKLLMLWHTFCLCVDTAVCAVVFVYGWFLSMVAWPFIIPAIGYTVGDVGTLVAYLAVGPLRVNTSPLWQPIGPAMALQSTFFSLAPVFLHTAKVCSHCVNAHAVVLRTDPAALCDLPQASSPGCFLCTAVSSIISDDVAHVPVHVA